MTRIPNWSLALVRWAERQNRLPFEWGVTDCGSLCRRGLELIFGAPILDAPFYATEAEAEKVMKQLGSAASYFATQGGSTELLSRASGGDVIVRPGVDDGLPRLALVLYPGTVLTSDLEYGPHLVKARTLKRTALLYRFGR